MNDDTNGMYENYLQGGLIIFTSRAILRAVNHALSNALVNKIVGAIQSTLPEARVTQKI